MAARKKKKSGRKKSRKKSSRKKSRKKASRRSGKMPAAVIAQHARTLKKNKRAADIYRDILG